VFKLLTKIPEPAPSEVFESEIVGFVLVLQQTPLAVTVDLPSEVTSPPPEAVLKVITVTEAVDSDATVTVSVFLQPLKRTLIIEISRKVCFIEDKDLIILCND